NAADYKVISTNNNEYEIYENIVLKYWDGRTEIMPIKFGEEVTELPDLSGQCEFKGWYTDPEFTEPFVPFTSGDKNHSKLYYANGNGSFILEPTTTTNTKSSTTSTTTTTTTTTITSTTSSTTTSTTSTTSTTNTESTTSSVSDKHIAFYDGFV
ncbi:MAG: hypothetical protein IIY35_06385, partial [Ruminococcus sp.]|nr:hypothetical protein [Ruminococcus sp.]